MCVRHCHTPWFRGLAIYSPHPGMICTVQTLLCILTSPHTIYKLFFCTAGRTAHHTVLLDDMDEFAVESLLLFFGNIAALGIFVWDGYVRTWQIICQSEVNPIANTWILSSFGVSESYMLSVHFPKLAFECSVFFYLLQY